MGHERFDALEERPRLGWWLYLAVLAVAATYITYSFVGMVVLGVFGYYATRPIHRHLVKRIDSRGITAGLTIILVLLPIIVLLVYAGFQAFHQIQLLLRDAAGFTLPWKYFNLGALSNTQRQTLVSTLQNPSHLVSNPRQTVQTLLQAGAQILSAVVNALLVLVLALTLSYFLLKNDDALSAGLRDLFGGRETTAYAYAAVVDDDLESVFFGNLLFVVAMAVIAAVAYWVTNLLAPQGLHVPMVLVLAFFTGVASLIPIVVGKIVYLPVVAYLGIQAVRAGGGSLLFVGAVLVAYFLVLDILPQTILQPYITSRQLNMVMLMFAYILGPVLFGWYGFFLLPIVFIAMFEAVRIVLPELVHGEALTPTVSIGESAGPDPQSLQDTPPDGDSEADTD